MKINGSRRLVPEATIQNAIQGDMEAMGSILAHYEPYICHLATRPFRDDYGNVLRVVDPEIKGQLESQLIQYVFQFKPAS